MNRRPLLLLIAALAPAVTIAVALMLLTAVRERARQHEAAEHAALLQQDYLESQHLASQVQDFRQLDHLHQDQARERERTLADRLTLAERQLTQTQEALRACQERLGQALGRLIELSHPVSGPSASAAAAAAAASAPTAR